MTASHLFLRDAGASVPERWMQAFPDGSPLDQATLQQRVHSHSMAHAIVWLSTDSPEPWLDRVGGLLSLQSDLKIVLLSGVPTQAEGLQAIQTGVRGYAHSHAVPALLREVALVVHHGGLWLGPELMRHLVQVTAGALAQRVPPQSALAQASKETVSERSVISTLPDGSPRPLPTAQARTSTAENGWLLLTTREREIAHAVARGRSNKEIAAVMQISEKTVKAHLGAVFQKLAVRDRLQLVVRMASVNAS